MRKFVLSLLIMLSFSVVSLAANGTAEKQKTVKVVIIGAADKAEIFAQTVLAKVEALEVLHVKNVVSVMSTEKIKFKNDVIKLSDYQPPNMTERKDNFKLQYAENKKYKTTAKKQKPFRSPRDGL